jgi:hypothetical protein
VPKRFLKWLMGVVASGLVWWLFTVGVGLIVSALVASASDVAQLWISFLATGVFLATAGLVMLSIRAVTSLLPPKTRRRLGGPPPRSLSPLTFPFFSPAHQLTNLIEEGRGWARVIPEPAHDPRGNLVQRIAGADVNYPARVFEWERRVWQLLSGPQLAPYRGLFPEPRDVHRLHGLREHLEERIQQLATILGRL